jgi:hypothetical protein
MATGKWMYIIGRYDLLLYLIWKWQQMQDHLFVMINHVAINQSSKYSQMQENKWTDCPNSIPSKSSTCSNGTNT